MTGTPLRPAPAHAARARDYDRDPARSWRSGSSAVRSNAEARHRGGRAAIIQVAGPAAGHFQAVPFRACEYELADSGRALGRVLPGWCLVALGDSLRA